MTRKEELQSLKRRLEAILNDFSSTTVVCMLGVILTADKDEEERMFGSYLNRTVDDAVCRRG